MSVTSTRNITVAFQGDVTYNQRFDAVSSTLGPGTVTTTTLTTGNNTITIPSGSTGVTLIPASTNTNAMTVKGVNGDTGLSIATTSPSSFGITSTTSLVIAAAGAVSLRIIFS